MNYQQQNMYGNMPNFNWMFFGMPMNKGNNNFNYGMNFNNNEFWTNIYGNGINMQTMNQGNQLMNSVCNKVNLVFKTTGGLKTNLIINYGTTVSEALLIYLKRVGKPELFDPNSGIFFLYNAKRINLNDNTKIEDFIRNFGNQINPIIIVNDVKNLIGAL